MAAQNAKNNGATTAKPRAKAKGQGDDEQPKVRGERQPRQVEHQVVQVGVPIASTPSDLLEPGAVSLRLSSRQGRTVRRVLDAMAARNVRLQDGRAVESGADLVRYLLDAMHDEADQAGP
jgi:hypothetical protein